jgi:ProP effector
MERIVMSNSQKRVREAITKFCEQFPAAFTRTDRRPLKIGIRDELLALGFDRKLVVMALRSYCRGSSYLAALREGADRIGLDGQTSGVVTAEEEKIAVALLEGNLARAMSRRMETGAKAAKPKSDLKAKLAIPGSPDGARRLSLSDLRDAGRRRRA